jgi:uncharacterized protein YndB with AHSA1/START domain
MLVRQVVIPASPERLWDALTEADALSAWFGSRVEWDLRPGGQARFVEHDGTVRGGVIEAVQPARHLRFRWWPEAGAQDAMTQVSYDLEPEEDGTRLTVTESQVVTDPASTPIDGALRGSASLAGGPDGGPTTVGVSPWSDWDARLFRCWAGVASPAPVGAVLR